jgi:hypothetical protein
LLRAAPEQIDHQQDKDGRSQQPQQDGADLVGLKFVPGGVVEAGAA